MYWPCSTPALGKHRAMQHELDMRKTCGKHMPDIQHSCSRHATDMHLSVETSWNVVMLDMDRLYSYCQSVHVFVHVSVHVNAQHLHT